MRRAYAGLSFPLGYDYRNPIRPRSEDQSDIANPVLENTTGLLLCYDELWFPSRDFCPLDMHDLAYVRFVADDAILLKKAQEAQDQFQQLDPEEWNITQAPTSGWQDSVRRITSAAPFLDSIDNHSRGSGPFGMGNAGDEKLFMGDIGVARSLDMDIEVAVSSRLRLAAESLSELGTSSSLTARGMQIGENLTDLRTVDYIGPTGAYHECLEDLRSHPHLIEFRQFLASTDQDRRTAEQITSEANCLVDQFLNETATRYFVGRGRFNTLSRAALGPLGNLVAPGLGSASKVVVSLLEQREKKAFLRQISWALLVSTARTLNKAGPSA